MEQLKEIRQSKKITQVELSNLIGYDQSIISQWEHGTRDPGTDALIKLSNVLNVSVDAILGNTNFLSNNSKISIQQKNCIEEISSLSDVECMQVLTFIKTMKQVKKEADLDALRILKLNDND